MSNPTHPHVLHPERSDPLANAAQTYSDGLRYGLSPMEAHDMAFSRFLQDFTADVLKGVGRDAGRG